MPWIRRKVGIGLRVLFIAGCAWELCVYAESSPSEEKVVPADVLSDVDSSTVSHEPNSVQEKEVDPSNKGAEAAETAEPQNATELSRETSLVETSSEETTQESPAESQGVGELDVASQERVPVQETETNLPRETETSAEVSSEPQRTVEPSSKASSVENSSEKSAPEVSVESQNAEERLREDNPEELTQPNPTPLPESPISEVVQEGEGKVKPELDRAAPEIMAILKRGTLRVGMCTIDQPPFHERGRNGEFVGKDIDLARDLADALGVKLRFVEAPDWASTVELLLDGKIDIVLSNLTLLPERAARIYCSKPYAKIRQCMLLNRVLLTRAYSKGLVTLRELLSEGDNRHLIIQEGTAYATTVTNMFPRAEVTITTSWEEIMKKICDRECIGTISDELEIKKQTRTVQSMELLSVVLKGLFDSMVIGVSHEAPHLLHFINSFIDYNGINFDVEDF